MALKTLAELRLGARQRADMEDDGNLVGLFEANDYVNDGISDLYDLIIDGDSEALFSVHAPLVTQVGTNSYALPLDFYRLVSVDLLVDGRYREGRPADVREIAQLSARPPQARDFRYSLRFNPGTGTRQIFTYPEIDEASLSVVYVPEAPNLSTDTDTMEGFNNWHEYVMIYAAIRMMSKEEADTTQLQLQKQELTKRIQRHIRDIDTGLPEQIRDVAHIYADDRNHYWGR